jgi:hypothetical protein
MPWQAKQRSSETSPFELALEMRWIAMGAWQLGHGATARSGGLGIGWGMFGMREVGRR